MKKAYLFIKSQKTLRLWLPVILWTELIFCLSSIPFLRTSLDQDFILRKMAHVAEYFVLTYLLYRAFRNSFQIKGLRLFSFPIGTALLYTLSDEFHQLFVPGRVGCLKDIAIDGIGIAIAAFCFIAVLLIKKSPSALPEN